jgi:hypothetical protein
VAGDAVVRVLDEFAALEAVGRLLADLTDKRLSVV